MIFKYNVLILLQIKSKTYFCEFKARWINDLIEWYKKIQIAKRKFAI